MKNFRRGTAANRPKNAHTRVMVRMRPKSSLGFSDNRLRRYIAGRPATKRPAMPPAPVAEAWIIEFSWGPKRVPIPGTPGRTLVRRIMKPGMD